MKLIDPKRDARVQALEADNTALQQQILALQQENERLKRTGSGRALSSCRSSAVSLATARNRYLNPTAASQSRVASISSAPGSPIEKVVPQRDEIGRLVICKSVQEARFAGPKVASKSSMSEPDANNDEPEDGGSTDWNGPGSNEVYPEEIHSRACAEMTKAAADTEPTSLSHRSRLVDIDFYRTPASKIRLPFQRQGFYLGKAYALAQKTLWLAFRKHWPEALRNYYLEGPQTILFGVGDLQQVFGTLENPSGYAGLCNKPPEAVNYAIHDVVKLRNAFCHQRPRLLSELDSLIQTAQYLAVMLLDEERADKVRYWRDEMQKEAQKEWQKIVDYEPLMHLPLRQFKIPVHHELLFKDVCAQLKNGEAASEQAVRDYGIAVIQAARAWQVQGGIVGEADTERLANLEKKRAEAEEGMLEEDRPADVKTDETSEVKRAAEEPAEDTWTIPEWQQNLEERVYETTEDGW